MPSHENDGSGIDQPKKPLQTNSTVITPYIHSLFSHNGFEEFKPIIIPVVLNDEVAKKRQEQIRITQSLHPEYSTQPYQNQQMNRDSFLASIKPGDVISTPPDGEGTGSNWRREVSEHHNTKHAWYALVQHVQVQHGRRSFDVIWMYEPRDTPCALMKYPWKHELFLSNVCTCDGPRIDEKDVLAVHQVDWFVRRPRPRPATGPDCFFVRQTYNADEHCWVTLKDEHLCCKHYRPQRELRHDYVYGDTVLVKTRHPYLEVYIIELLFSEGKKRFAKLQHLPKRNEITNSKEFPANELVWSHQHIEIDVRRIMRRCIVRAFRPGDKIPTPYNRSGTGDAFYFTYQQNPVAGSSATDFLAIQDPQSYYFRQGYDPLHKNQNQIHKLRGLDLFCGGGNFGRGIEDGGAVEMRWANDIAFNAVHTYMANTQPNKCTPYLGSVDDLLHRALLGETDVPHPGDVQFLTGGSPCQGFSRLTHVEDQKSIKQQKNRSLIASFASYIDFYRPQYGILENVTSIVKTGKDRVKCPFSQLVCAIVGMGYQVRIVYADAWSYGAPQSRSRVFLCFAAPGVRMPKAPTVSHSHPPQTRMGSLGRMSNDQPFGQREDNPTPFKFVSASEATDDLPDVYDGKPDLCVGYPDHRLAIGYTMPIMSQLRYIPFHPWGMSFDKTYHGYFENDNFVQGILSESDRLNMFPKPGKLRVKKGSKGWGRVHPHGLFQTVVTACGPSDSRVGVVSHWQEPRPLTILEARRAQGFLDHELLLGKPSDQWHIIGNSVARQVALALGLAIREAWFGTLYDEDILEEEQEEAEKQQQQAVPVAATEGLLPNVFTAVQATQDMLVDIDVVETDTSSSSEQLFDTFPEVSSPATSVDSSDDAGGRKRRATSIFVEIIAKKIRGNMGGI
ncbi:S-adenosyl-L-methionine-dependent methyltransferase [Xylariales sp. PMI_506]|nr:S-adenosyl-L-methionine-dependent methyltransferase [Xylariales sp. PMI_506]